MSVANFDIIRRDFNTCSGRPWRIDEIWVPMVAEWTGPVFHFPPGIDQHRINTFLDQVLPGIRMVTGNRMPQPVTNCTMP